MAKITLQYKPNLEEVVDRHKRLWNGQLPDRILAAVFPKNLPFVDPLGCTPDIKSMIAAWEHNYRVRQSIQDDLLPVARVSFGSAAFGAYLGAKVSFHGWGGWSQPFLDSYDKVTYLHYDPDNPWILRQEKACRQFAVAAKGKFAVCETEPIDALNLAELLRGSQVYSDIYDHPQDLHHLLSFACDFNIRFLEMQREILASCLYYQEGVFSIFRIWLPGQAVWISVDAYGNCSPKTFREFGAPYLQRTIDYFGGGWIHVHAFALHLLPELAKLSKVLGIGVCDDPNVPSSFFRLKEIRKTAPCIPLQIDCSKDEIENGIQSGDLPGGVMYMVRDGVADIWEANSLMDKVRAYQAP